MNTLKGKEISRNAEELITEEEKEKRRAEKRRAKKKRRREKKKMEKVTDQDPVKEISRNAEDLITEEEKEKRRAEKRRAKKKRRREKKKMEKVTDQDPVKEISRNAEDLITEEEKEKRRAEKRRAKKKRRREKKKMEKVTDQDPVKEISRNAEDLITEEEKEKRRAEKRRAKKKRRREKKKMEKVTDQDPVKEISRNAEDLITEEEKEKRRAEKRRAKKKRRREKKKMEKVTDQDPVKRDDIGPFGLTTFSGSINAVQVSTAPKEMPVDTTKMSKNKKKKMKKKAKKQQQLLDPQMQQIGVENEKNSMAIVCQPESDDGDIKNVQLPAVDEAKQKNPKQLGATVETNFTRPEDKYLTRDGLHLNQEGGVEDKIKKDLESERPCLPSNDSQKPEEAPERKLYSAVVQEGLEKQKPKMANKVTKVNIRKPARQRAPRRSYRKLRKRKRKKNSMAIVCQPESDDGDIKNVQLPAVDEAKQKNPKHIGPTFETNGVKKLRYFHDHQNMPSFIDSGDFLKYVIKDSNIVLYVFYGPESSEHLSKYIDAYKNVEFVLEEHTKDKNAIDILMVGFMCYYHTQLPEDVNFKVISGDNSFLTLQEPFNLLGRKMDVFSPHHKPNETDGMSIIDKIHNQEKSSPPQLRKKDDEDEFYYFFQIFFEYFSSFKVSINTLARSERINRVIDKIQLLETQKKERKTRDNEGKKRARIERINRVIDKVQLL